MMFYVLIPTPDGRRQQYAYQPTGAVAAFDHHLEAQAFCDVFLQGQTAWIVRESWAERAEEMRRDIRAGRPIQGRGAL